MGYRAKVINGFQDKEHDNRIYKPGEVYPAEGYKTTKKRIEYLSKEHPEYKKAFVADIQEDEDDDKGKAKTDKE